jgi:hypothetical protein
VGLSLERGLSRPAKSAVASFCDRLSACAPEQPSWLFAFVGGAHAKHCHDASSDVDTSIVLSDKQRSIESLVSSLSGVQNFAGSGRYGCKFLVISEHSPVLDVNLFSHAFCQDCISSFESGADISNANQDFLWNLCHGIRAWNRGSAPVYRVEFTDTARQKILRKFLLGLSLHKLDVYYRRSDWLQIHESTLSVAKVLTNLGYALNRELFWGYKHLHARMGQFPAVVTNAFTALRNVDAKNWPISILDLEQKLRLVRILANTEIGNG